MKRFLALFKKGGSASIDLNYADFSNNRRWNVFSILCIIGTITAFLQGLNDLILGFPFVALLDVFLGIILLISYFINRYGYHHFAKIFLFTTSNFSLFCFAAVVPQGVGIFLLFFPLVIFYFISFKFEDRAYSFGFTFLALILNIILLATDYQPFGAINIQPTDTSSSFGINLILSLVLIGIGINYLIKMNHLTQELLLKQQEKSDTLSKKVKENNLTLKKTNIELDRFVYSTSHDLKAPLASISGLLNLAKMEKEPVPEFMHTYLDMMEERVQNLNLFIKDILDYSRNSRLGLTFDKVNISALVREVFETNKYLENATKVKLTSKVAPSLICKIDKNRIFRVLMNLISNAIKYSDLSKKNPSTQVSAIIKSNQLIIKVEDNGIGISEENKDKIFDMFYRGTELADGSGLGLYITQEMVHKMNGNLTFESQLGEGTTFILKFPTKTL